MASKDLSIDIDLRQTIKEHVSIRVQVKNILIVKIGLFFIRFGCWLSGAQYVKEFPMSLLQNDKEVEMESDFVHQNFGEWLNKQ